MTILNEATDKRKAIYFMLFLAICLFTFSTSLSNAQTLGGRVTRYSIPDGLSFGVVNSIAQDRKGYIWVATDDGLNRFDGHSFKVYKHNSEDKNSVSGNYIKSLLQDKDGTIWVSSRNGLNEFIASKEQFAHHIPSTQKPGTSNDVSDISPAKNGDLWVSLNGTGFASFNRSSKAYTFYDQKTLPGLISNSVLNVFEDSQGLVWLGTRDTGIELFHIDANRKLTKSDIDFSSLPKVRINRIYEDRFHNVWIASAKGLFLYKRNEGRFYVLNINTFHNSRIYLSVVENQSGMLLVGVQDGGVYRLDLNKARGQSPDRYTFEQVKSTLNQGITQRSVQSLYKDRDQNIWLGTYGEGLYLIGSIPEKFRLFEKKIVDSRAETYLRYYGMCHDKDGNLWLGTDGDGIYKTDSSGEVIKHYSADGRKGSITDGAVIAAYRDAGDNLWFGTYSQGLFLYNKATDSFIHYAHKNGDPESLPANDVRVIFEDSKKQIWVGTNGGGLARMDRKTEKFTQFIPSNSSINSNDVRAITQDGKGNLWIGTYGGGLNYLNQQTMRFTQFFNSAQNGFHLSNRIILSLYMDARNRLFVGSEGNGLLLFDIKKKTAKLYSEKNGLANNVINAIQPESGEKIWLSTNKGLSRIDLSGNKIENFDQSDGLQSGQFNPGSTLYNEKGKYICFGGTEGWNLFYPQQIVTSKYKPEVLVTGIELFGKTIEIGSEQNGNIILDEQIGDQTQITLQPDQSVFTIQYTALNYPFPEKGSFAYKLEGLDKDWNFVQNERAATYRYLPPGDYVFKVKASNQDGLWFDQYSSLNVRILPPWYQTWWAYLLYIGIAAAVIYYYQKYKSRQAELKYEIQLAHFETQKEKELNERKISYFTNISHEFRTPLTLIINPVKELLQKEGQHDPANLNIIHRNAKRLLSLVDQLLLFRKADQKQDDLNLGVHHLPTLINDVFQCFVYQAEQKNIRYEFICDNADIEITADLEKLEIALFNLISNALKFTPEKGRVTVKLSELNKQVEILVEDTGIGIPQDAGDKIFSVFNQYPDKQSLSKGGFGIGLFLAKTFVQNHAGELTYQSTPEQGTTFRILLWKNHPTLKTGELAVKPTHHTSVFLEELTMPDSVGFQSRQQEDTVKPVLEELNTQSATMLIVDDDSEMRKYLIDMFREKYKLIEANSGEQGLELIRKHAPDIVLSDVMMDGMSGIEMCSRMKEDLAVSHIPLVLLTASSSQESKLKGIEGGADDYISKPFDKDLLVARVASILKNRNDLQKYFYNEITLQSGDFKISAEYKEFLQRCIAIVESHITDSDFNIKVLASEIGMSHSTLYNRIKSISGQSTNSFIRFIRLRRAAEILISTDTTILETAYQVGINDIKYFREQFTVLFGMKPSEYIKKYRKPFHEQHALNKDIFKSK
ncbi:two-component regulator propeller domain-containing protein [Dyadobacter sp. CY312]|uniref:two-component regulator propeller domain-containing protein n=1 Tax=Dyadobacter sp. CY312 TaxID=2907303 RepID=UPI001F2A59D0|nr:two-component regulator propeller domain-containing protein [Dyadobacter sp. CY312]MCE7040469.1 response regulator [Dyadobacter sp. CY312]